MNKRSIIIITLLFLAIGLVLIVNPQEKQVEGETKIGGLFALTGDAARAGEFELKAVELAIDEINAKGGVNGKNLRLITEDFELDNAKAVSAYQKLRNVDGIRFFIGPTWSDASITLAPLMDQDQTIAITPSASLLPEKRSNIFSTWPSDKDSAKKLAETIHSDGILRLALLSIQNLWSENLEDSVTKSFGSLGGEVVYRGQVSGVGDIRTEIAKIQPNKPEAVYLAFNVPELVQYLKDAKELGITFPIYGTDAVEDPELTSLSGPLADGIKYIWPKEARDEDFVQKFKTKYGQEPAMSAEEAYDAVMILVKTLKQCEEQDSECVRREIANLRNFHGASGVFSITESGFPEKEFIVKTIRERKFIEVK